MGAPGRRRRIAGATGSASAPSADNAEHPGTSAPSTGRASGTRTSDQRRPRSAVPALPTPAEQKIIDALRSPTELEFTDTPLVDVIDYLTKHHGIKILIDKKATDKAGIGLDVREKKKLAKVTINIKGVSLRSALRLMLREWGLTYLPADDGLLITSTKYAEDRLTTRIYPVTDLVAAAGDKRGDGPGDFQPLIDAIRCMIQPGTGPRERRIRRRVPRRPRCENQVRRPANWVRCWDSQRATPRSSSADSPRTPTKKSSVCSSGLREVKAAANGRDATAAVDVPLPGPAEQKIETALASPTQFDFVDTPLKAVVDHLKDFHHIEIQLDKKAMDAAGIRADAKVTKHLKGVTLSAALRLVLHELGLACVIQDEVLLITPTEAAECRLPTRIYPVTDIVEHRRDAYGNEHPDLDGLVETIHSTVFPTTWDEVGGPGAIATIAAGQRRSPGDFPDADSPRGDCRPTGGAAQGEPAGAPPAPPPGPGPAAPRPRRRGPIAAQNSSARSSNAPSRAPSAANRPLPLIRASSIRPPSPSGR